MSTDLEPSNLPPSTNNVGMVIRQREPVNFEYPFDQLDTFLTPSSLFYIRSHFKVPKLEADSYELKVDGAVATRLSLRYGDLRRMPSKTQVATLECAGNSRIFLVPQVEGAQWQLGAVGNAEWTGVPLRHLLDTAGLSDDAIEIIFEGADCGTPKEKPIPPEPISYARSLSREKALSSEVLVAYQMNGQDLPQDHGYPVRLIVPGHYGMASVKWLTRIHAVREKFDGYWQTSDYAYWGEIAGQPVRVPLGEMAVKSQISRPRTYEVLPGGQPYRIFGASWCGNAEVKAVEVSADGGSSWASAELLDSPLRFAWRRFQYTWQVPEQRGRYQLMARAKDSMGRQQPEQHNPNFGTYVIHHPFVIEVFVEYPKAENGSSPDR
ncbi:MAG: sulfite oxidase [Acidobacteriota bacterium]|nr:sulfite oxidase [Acidobacteriota bacterium]